MYFISSLFNYLFYSMLLLPNSSTVCKGSDKCPIIWDNPIDGHIEMQLASNNSWTSETDDGKSYLSVIVDRTTNQYDWLVPQYITQTWEQPKRVVLANLDDSQHYYSDEFTIYGVTMYTGLSTQITSSTHIPISWKSNDNTTFGIYLTNGMDIIETIEMPALPQNHTYLWEVPYIPAQDMNIMVRSYDNMTYDISPRFQITTTTTPTTMVTTVQTTTATSFDVDNSYDDIQWWLIAIIIFSCVLTLYAIIYVLTNVCFDKKRSSRVYPSLAHKPQVLTNPVYDTRRSTSFYNNTNRPLPPISLPTNLRHISNGMYETVEKDRYAHLEKTTRPIRGSANLNLYNNLNHN